MTAKLRDLQLSVPEEWTCPTFIYASFNVCDCECGAPDPDCDTDPPLSVRFCNEGEICVEGICAIPFEWTCDSESFGSDDGCDCNCGVRDPDCFVNECGGNNPYLSLLFMFGFLALLVLFGYVIKRCSRKKDTVATGNVLVIDEEEVQRMESLEEAEYIGEDTSSTLPEAELATSNRSLRNIQVAAVATSSV